MQREEIDLSHINDRVNVLGSLGWDLQKFKDAWIMVIGAGALGNEVLKNLALIGVGNIFLIDFDIIENSNLARSILYREEDCTGDKTKVDVAAMRLRELNPELNIIPLNGDISIDVGWGIFRRMDVVIGCVDNRLARLYINRISHQLGKTWVDGGIVDLGGQMNVFEPGVSCYECTLSEKAWQIIRYRMGCADRAMRYASSGQANTIPITSSIIGALQVQEALKVIAKQKGAEARGDQQFYYEGMSYTSMYLPTSPLREKCESHTRVDHIVDAPELSSTTSVKETLDWLIAHFKDEQLAIALDHTLILEVRSDLSGKKSPLICPRPHLKAAMLSQFAEEPGDEVRVTADTSEIDRNFAYQDLPLNKLGIPPLHIIKVYTGGEKKYVELSGDIGYLSSGSQKNDHLNISHYPPNF